MDQVELKKRLCNYVYRNFRSKYSSNRDFALSCGIDEKTIRLIQQGKYNMSVELLNRICVSQNTKISDVFKAIED